MNKRTAVIYARVSSVGDRQDTSRQIRDLEILAKEKSLKVVNTYEFKILVGGSWITTYTQSNNPSYAYQKARRLYPAAEEIKLIRLVRQRMK